MSPERHIWPSMAALRAFEAAARRLSFTEAAAELGRTQGAISHQLRELEARLEVKLFSREARGIGLTDAGKLYLPFVQESLDRLRAGDAALRPAVDDGVLTVTCSPNFAAKWLVPRLGDFIRSHPEIDLRISATMHHVSFAGDGIDMAVRHGDGNWPHLRVTRLCEEQLIPVCSPHLIPPDATAMRVADLADYSLIHHQDRSAWAQWLEAVGAPTAAFDFERGPIISEASLALDAAVAGQGIALSRSALADLDLRAGRLVRPVPDAVPATFAYWIVYPKPNGARKSIRRFQRWLIAQQER